MGECQSHKHRSIRFDDMDITNDNNQKKFKKCIGKLKKSNSRKIINGGRNFVTSEKNKDANEKQKKHKSPEREVISDYENRPSLKIVTRKAINNSTILLGKYWSYLLYEFNSSMFI